MEPCPWHEKFIDSLLRFAGETVAEAVMEGCENIETLEKKAKWTKRAIDKLDELVPDEELRKQIMMRCSCACSGAHIIQLREEFKKTNDIDHILDAMHGTVFFNKPVRKGNIIYVTKAACRAKEYSQAKAEHEKRLYYCHCDNVRATKEQVSPTYCLCSAGWCKQIFDAVLGRPVKVTIHKSVLQGDKECVYAVEI